MWLTTHNSLRCIYHSSAEERVATICYRSDQEAMMYFPCGREQKVEATQKLKQQVLKATTEAEMRKTRF